jgi:ribosome recycling factor
MVAPAAERRKRVALRRLIDEMLAEIRAAANEENWTADARAQAESDLARIMDQVRREAMRAEPKPKARRAKSR